MANVFVLCTFLFFSFLYEQLQHLCSVRQVPLPSSRPMATEPAPVNVKVQDVPKQPAVTTSDAMNKGGAKPNVKQTESSECKKSSKPEKKQG